MKAVLAYLTFSRFCYWYSALARSHSFRFSSGVKPVGQVSHLEARPTGSYSVRTVTFGPELVHTTFLLVLTTLGANHVCDNKVSILHMGDFHKVLAVVFLEFAAVLGLRDLFLYPSHLRFFLARLKFSFPWITEKSHWIMNIFHSLRNIRWLSIGKQTRLT